MKTSQRIREQLRASDGMTVRQLSDALAIEERHIRHHLSKTMPDAYIDRWTESSHAVWCVVEVPPHCPRP